MVPKNLKNCGSFKAQERHNISKAFKSEIYLEMPKKIKDGCYSLFSSLFVCWFKPVEVRNHKCVFMLYFFLEVVWFLKKF
jgi:hypothetical protein